ncbi:MAG: hypothetical protein HOL01_03640 [Planctomycetaceae bacterium]|nr:hypothetical protein [Planctomycetaceae bacterium]MBT6486942.1 hypothetical protein [Planctomycetaceae bacterium]MBT6493626.1 hypothetical protein [Planctomycetaceae bacterium]
MTSDVPSQLRPAVPALGYCGGEWQSDLRELADRLTESCRNIDPESTDKAIEAVHDQSDIVAGESTSG